MACDLVRHLSGSWQHLKSDLPQLRAQKVSSVAAVQAFRSRLEELTNWVTEHRRILQEDLRPHFACRSIECSFEELVGRCKEPAVGDAVDRFAEYSARTSGYCSQVTSLLQKLELRKTDFDSLREEALRVSRLEILNPPCPPVQPDDAASLLTDYSTLLEDTRALISISERRITSQRELIQQWTTLRAQLGAVLVELTSRQAHLSQVLSCWDAFETAANELESSLRTLRTSLMSYEHPTAETVEQMSENADLLARVRTALSEANSSATPEAGSLLETQAVACRQRYDQIDVRLAALRTALEASAPSAQLDASVASRHKQAEQGFLGVQALAVRFADAWRLVHRTHLDYETQLA
ncbi:unnamed protein product, partial [Dibothriocephalus latus]